LLWFTNTENIAEWHKVTGYLPLRNSSVELLEKEGWFQKNPNFLTAVEQIRETTVTPATRGALLGTFPQTRNIVTRVMEELMLQGGDPVAAMKAAKAEADKLLKEYNALYE
jgi:sn-glycerol 3-phosphate transport system substrate-binding protein